MAHYKRRQPEKTVLYQVVGGHLETLLAEANERYDYGYPAHIEKTYRGYLSCGLLQYGFARVRCSACGKENLVAFSCKMRGICPSCEGRRMADVAAHLVDRVLPVASYRQWTLSVAYEYRLAMAADQRVLSDVLRRFIAEVFNWKRRQARKAGIDCPTPAAITLTQRFGSALNLHPHFHTLIPDGVFTCETPGVAKWMPLPGPSAQDIEHIATRVAIRVHRCFEERRDFADFAGDTDAAERDAQTLADTVHRPGLAPRPTGLAPPKRDDAAIVDGFSLHVGRAIAPADRAGLERLLRYGARPAFAQSRLSFTASGKVSYKLKRPWFNGQTHVTLPPVEFLRRLTALIPPPRTHLTRFHGAFAPAAKLRPAITALVPAPADAITEADPELSTAVDTDVQDNNGQAADFDVAAMVNRIGSVARDDDDTADNLAAKRKRYSWAKLLARVFDIDVSRCADPSCRGPTKIIAWITQPDVITKFLVHLGIDPHPPAPAPARAPPQAEFDFAYP